MNGALLDGVLQGCGADGLEVQPVAPPHPCCARITPASEAAAS
jgi:hypothetical protein